MLAAGKGHIATVQALLYKGADMNARDHLGQTALMLALQKGRTEVVKLLKQVRDTESVFIKKKSKEKSKGSLLRGMFHYIILPFVYRLLHNSYLKGFSIAVVFALIFLLIVIRKAYHLRNRYFDEVNSLKPQTNQSAPLNNTSTDRDKNQLNSDLITAAKIGHTDTVLALLNKSADTNSKGDKYGWTALMYAAIQGHIAVVQALLAKGADMNIKGGKDGWTALMLAVTKGHVDTVQALLCKDVDVNARSKVGVTALMIAALQGRTGIVEILLDNDADMNAKARNGATALMCAENKGHTETTELLKQAGAKE